MSHPTILEGTWEEIREHESELAGRYVRVQVLQKEPKKEQTGSKPETLADVFAGYIGKLSFEPTDLARKSEEYLEEGFGESSMAKRSDI